MEKPEKKDLLAGNKETLLAAEVKNHVIWVNPNFPELPFDIQEGRQTKLGMFLAPIVGKEEGTYPLEVARGHGRSGLAGRVIFKDNEGRIYRDVDLKGIGAVEEFNGLDNSLASRVRLGVGRIVPRGAVGGKEYQGILDGLAARWDSETAEYLTSKGVLAHRTIAIVALEELIDENGLILSIAEAKRRGLISDSVQPVIEIRAFGIKARISDARKESLIEDARLFAAKELGLSPKRFDAKQYSNWLMETIGGNLGRMHKNGWSHGYATSHNITLDGRLTDFDSARPTHDKEDFKEDLRQARSATEDLFVLQGGLESDLSRALFQKAYDAAIGEKPLK